MIDVLCINHRTRKHYHKQIKPSLLDLVWVAPIDGRVSLLLRREHRKFWQRRYCIVETAENFDDIKEKFMIPPSINAIKASKRLKHLKYNALRSVEWGD